VIARAYLKVGECTEAVPGAVVAKVDRYYSGI
jgi:hypothetical protein